MRTIQIALTDEMKDAARQAGMEGQEHKWAKEVLQIEAEKIVFSHRREEVKNVVKQSLMHRYENGL